jgi:hypothetical protein
LVADITDLSLEAATRFHSLETVYLSNFGALTPAGVRKFLENSLVLQDLYPNIFLKFLLLLVSFSDDCI